VFPKRPIDLPTHGISIHIFWFQFNCFTEISDSCFIFAELIIGMPTIVINTTISWTQCNCFTVISNCFIEITLFTTSQPVIVQIKCFLILLFTLFSNSIFNRMFIHKPFTPFILVQSCLKINRERFIVVITGVYYPYHYWLGCSASSMTTVIIYLTDFCNLCTLNLKTQGIYRYNSYNYGEK